MGDEHPNGWSSTRNFHICYASVRTMIGSRPDGWSWIGNFLNWWTRVWTKADCRPDGDIWIVILTLCMSASGRLKQSSFKLNLERIWSWSISERRPNGLLRCPDGCKLEQKLLDTVVRPNGKSRRPDGWCLVCRASKRYGTSFGWMEQWTNGRPDRMARSSRRLTGNRRFFDLQAESSETLLNSGIPCKTVSFTYKWFCPNRMRPLILTWHICYSITCKNMFEYFIWYTCKVPKLHCIWLRRE
jgi:hypothetical protein